MSYPHLFQLPDMMLKSLKLGAAVSKTGGEILGADMIYNYEQVLRQVYSSVA